MYDHLFTFSKRVKVVFLVHFQSMAVECFWFWARKSCRFY